MPPLYVAILMSDRRYTDLFPSQDQTARASEARLLESEVERQKDEVASLKRQLVEAQSVEKERKRLADKVDKFETKVSPLLLSLRRHFALLSMMTTMGFHRWKI